MERVDIIDENETAPQAAAVPWRRRSEGSDPTRAEADIEESVRRTGRQRRNRACRVVGALSMTFVTVKTVVLRAS
jgi:hypothetical protein